MQDEIADAVEARLRTPPNLIVVELTQTMLDAIQSAFQFVRRRGADDMGQFIGCHIESTIRRFTAPGLPSDRFGCDSRSQAPLGNAPPRSSASHSRETTSFYIERLSGKQSF